MRKTTDNMGNFPKFDYLTDIEMSPGNLARAQSTADDLARAAAERTWDAGTTRRLMETLAASDGDFTGGKESSLALQNRAVRLTLALSRLLAPFEARDKERWAKPSEEMQKLFVANDARVEFDPQNSPALCNRSRNPWPTRDPTTPRPSKLPRGRWIRFLQRRFGSAPIGPILHGVAR